MFDQSDLSITHRDAPNEDFLALFIAYGVTDSTLEFPRKAAYIVWIPRCFFLVQLINTGICKVRNEIKTKRNETERNETKSNETKRKRNKTKRNEI